MVLFLFLSSNNIENIEHFSLINFDNLETLNLLENKIVSIKPFAKTGKSKNAKELDLVLDFHLVRDAKSLTKMGPLLKTIDIRDYTDQNLLSLNKLDQKKIQKVCLHINHHDIGLYYPDSECIALTNSDPRKNFNNKLEVKLTGY